MAGRQRNRRAQSPLRMKDLCTQTGLSRQAVHFYIQQGLLPEGEKTGRNMAYYNQSHVDRLRLIRRLQEEHFLPLKAIRAVLDSYEQDDAFSPAQRQFLEAVKQKLRPSLGQQEQSLVGVAAALARTGLPRADFDELCAEGLVVVIRSKTSESMYETDVWLLELLANVRRIGLTRALGFSAKDLVQVDEVVSLLFRKEKALMTQRLAHMDAAAAAVLIAQALPYMNTLLVGLHDSKVRHYIAGL